MECKDFEPSIIQDSKILLLCKRLSKFTIDEISTISELEPNKLLPTINELISCGKLRQENGLYFYSKKQSISVKYSIFKYYPKVTIDMILRCFCESISTTKTSHIISMGEDQVQKFYTIFRTIIYERQEKRLRNFYAQEPQNARHRMFFDQEVYLYIYNKQVFVSEILLQSYDDKPLNTNDKAEFSKIYCYLTRNLTHNQNAHNLNCKIAETLWRRNKNFNELYFDLKNNLLKFSQ